MSRISDEYTRLVGKKALVFDALEWTKTGDIGDNSQFYKLGTITRYYMLESSNEFNGELKFFYDECVDVKFDYNPTKVSRGHFTSCIKIQ